MLLESPSCRAQPVLAGVPYDLPDPEKDKDYSCSKGFDADDFIVPFNDGSNKEAGSRPATEHLSRAALLNGEVGAARSEVLASSARSRVRVS